MRLRRSGPWWAEVLLSVVVLLILGALMFPFFAQRRNHGPNPCLSNVKQLGLGALMYASDHDDRFPDRDAWMDAARPNLSGAEGQAKRGFKVEHCPEVLKQTGDDMNLYGYAFNSLLSRVKGAAIDKPADTPLIYDSINLARNASDPFVSLPVPGRHEGRNMVVFVDGHAKSIKSVTEGGKP